MNNTGNSMVSFVSRPDLCYQSMPTLGLHLNQLKDWADIINKALSTYTNKDNPNYYCLQCKMKDRPRSVVVLPCDHQVLCSSCGPIARSCPLCGNAILSRKTMMNPHMELWFSINRNYTFYFNFQMYIKYSNYYPTNQIYWLQQLLLHTLLLHHRITTIWIAEDLKEDGYKQPTNQPKHQTKPISTGQAINQ